jgi:hypothetical protein
MTTSAPITLTLTAEWLDGYCRDLLRRTTSLEKRVTALDALQTFVTIATEPGEQATPGFAAIRATLAHNIDQARAELLQEYADRLASALRRHEVTRAATLFTALSRDGFWQLLGPVEARLGPEATAQVVTWCRQWLTEARSRGTAHSPYPDAIDFKAAGIDITEYLMFTDLNKFFHQP